MPSNREDALLLLAALRISHLVPLGPLGPPVQEQGIAIIEDGLRLSESELLSSGRKERFPVLMEVSGDAGQSRPRILEFSQVLGLRFRSDLELEDFRFRPVEEFDPESVPCRAEPALFDLPGEARFGFEDTGVRTSRREGLLADRFAAGLGSLLQLGRLRGDCLEAIARILDESRVQAGTGHAFSMPVLLNAGQRDDSPTEAERHAHAVVKAFLSLDRPSPRQAIEAVIQALSRLGPSDAHAQLESAWAEAANRVITGDRLLDGDLLRDERAIVLRAALLAAVVDEPARLASFLEAGNPSGPLVTSLAAFLIGLKRGLQDSPWEWKRGMAGELSSLVADLERSILEDREGVRSPLSFQVDIRTGAEHPEILHQGRVVLGWDRKPPEPEPVMEDPWEARFVPLGIQVLTRRSGGVWAIRLEDHEEVSLLRAGSPEARFPILVFRYSGPQKLRKPKELLELSLEQGRFWRLGRSEDDSLMLQCDLTDLPDGPARALLSTKLTEALERCLVPAKRKPATRRPARSKNPRPTAVPLLLDAEAPASAIAEAGKATSPGKEG